MSSPIHLLTHPRKRMNHPCFYALLIPIPARLDHLTSDVKDACFTSFVEIENLISEQKLIELKCVETKTVMDKKYFKFKDKFKSNPIKLFLNLSKKDFEDFIPLFNRLNEIFNS